MNDSNNYYYFCFECKLKKIYLQKKGLDMNHERLVLFFEDGGGD